MLESVRVSKDTKMEISQNSTSVQRHMQRIYENDFLLQKFIDIYSSKNVPNFRSISLRQSIQIEALNIA